MTEEIEKFSAIANERKVRKVLRREFFAYYFLRTTTYDFVYISLF